MSVPRSIAMIVSISYSIWERFETAEIAPEDSDAHTHWSLCTKILFEVQFFGSTIIWLIVVVCMAPVILVVNLVAAANPFADVAYVKEDPNSLRKRYLTHSVKDFDSLMPLLPRLSVPFVLPNLSTTMESMFDVTVSDDGYTACLE